VLIVSGFLGSGKTTLVRHLLDDAQRDGVRMAVVSNEFGELGIDAALLSGGQDDYVEIRGGCVCCRLSDALVDTLQNLRERARPDRIVVETSGVALPFDTQLHLWRDPVAQWIADDVAVVVVNAEQVASGRDLDDTFAQQVSSADVLLLNQVDRVREQLLPGIEARLRGLEPEAPIVRAVRGAVAPVLLFPPDVAALRRQRREAGAAAPPHTHEDFTSEEIAVAPGVSSEALLQQIASLGALRVKGFVETDAGMRLVQGVGPRVELSPPDPLPAPELLGRLVVIRRPPR
jgi:cobalamin biosynthesis protein CobW